MKIQIVAQSIEVDGRFPNIEAKIWAQQQSGILPKDDPTDESFETSSPREACESQFFCMKKCELCRCLDKCIWKKAETFL